MPIGDPEDYVTTTNCLSSLKIDASIREFVTLCKRENSDMALCSFASSIEASSANEGDSSTGQHLLLVFNFRAFFRGQTETEGKNSIA